MTVNVLESTVDTTRDFDSWIQVSGSFVFILFSHLQCSSSHPFIYNLHHNPLVSGVRHMFVDQWSVWHRERTTWQKCQTPEIIRPFTSSRNSYFKNKAKDKTFVVKISFIFMRIKNPLHINYLPALWDRELRKLWNGSTSSMVSKIISYLSSSWM